MSHTFDTCHLRCYSLLVIDSFTQRIILATKEICTLLGYLPSQLIGHHLTVLNLQHLDGQRCVFRHESSHSMVIFNVCRHHDDSLEVDYWCLHAVSPTLVWNTATGGIDHHSNMNIVRLDTHGNIEHTAAKTDLIGKPLKSLIHADDRQRLVDGLNEQQTTYQVLFLRWLQGHNKIDDKAAVLDKEGNSYQWISLTMLTVPKRLSYGGTQHDDTTARRQLMIIRPATHPHPSAMPILSPTISSSSPFIAWSFRGLQVMRIMFGFCLGMVVEGWLATWETVYQGQRYMVEFLAHLLISILDFLADCIDPAPSSTSSVRVVLSHEDLKKQQQNNDGGDHITEVPWLRPLHRKRWATAVRTLRKHVQSNTVAQKSLGVLESIGVVQSCNMFDYLEKVTSERSHTAPPPIKNKQL